MLSGIPGRPALRAVPGTRARVALGNESAGLAARHKAQILEAVDRQMRKACPWQRTGGVVDHQMVDVVVSDAGLGKGGGAGDANAREEVKS